MKKIEINKKEFLKFLKETKRVTGVVPSTSVISAKYKVCRKVIHNYLYFLEKEGDIVINRGKKGNNYYNLI